MHKIAETGIASHWVYKQNSKDIEKINSRWVQDLVSILDQDQGPEDFLENTKLEMYADKVFCFTPNGDLIALVEQSRRVSRVFIAGTPEQTIEALSNQVLSINVPS